MCSEKMRKRKKHLLLKLTAGGILLLLLLRVDFLRILKGGRYLRESSGKENSEAIDGQVVQNKGSNILREMLQQTGNKDACDIPHLKNAIRLSQGNPSACVQTKPRMSSCRLAQEIFGLPPASSANEVCHQEQRREFCHISRVDDQYAVTCDQSKCDGQLYLATVHPDTGVHTWKPYKRRADIEQAISQLIVQENTGFCMVQCAAQFSQIQWEDGLVERMEVPDTGWNPSQILTLPPILGAQHKVSAATTTITANINFNFIFIDSVSRNHFFRSLPRSVDVLESLLTTTSNFDYALPSTVALDYELVQGVRSRTFETLQALFSGKINPKEKPFGTQDMPPTALDVGSLLGPLKQLGYSTLWLEDLCPLWEWGLVKDLLAYNGDWEPAQKWQTLKQALVNASIDSIGNTLSSCRMLFANGAPDPFHGPEKICYNGRHQHEYLLDYLTQYQELAVSKSLPFFTFIETNIGHEGTGKRIQLLDAALANYLKFSTKLKNTMTVLLSDHGNAYGTFVKKSPEGRAELYHPLMFMIIPNDVKRFIGESGMKALIENQQRLISILDLHYTIASLIESLFNKTYSHSKIDKFKSSVSVFNRQFDLSEAGLLTPVSQARTCSVIPRIMPNLCICAGYEVAEDDHKDNHVLALFAAGEINNEILEQKWTGDHSVVGFDRCQRLRVDSVKNVRRSKNGAGSHVIKMDIHVKHPDQKETEVFYIAASQHRANKSMTLISYDRVTPYAKFSQCADSGVETSLCICDLKQQKLKQDVSDKGKNKNSDEALGVVKRILGNRSLSAFLDKALLYPDMTLKVSDVEVDGSKCLHVVSQHNIVGVVYEAVSLCSVAVWLHLTLISQNLMMSRVDDSVIIRSGDIVFLAAGVQIDGNSEWTCESDVQFQVL